MDIFIDFETYCETPKAGKGLDLNKIPTPSYVHDERFHIHCAAIAYNREPTKIYYGEALEKELQKIKDIPIKTIIAHNYNFDGYILSSLYKIKPTIARCTLSMFRASGYVDITKHASLDKIAEFLALPRKLDGVVIKTFNKTTSELQEDKELWNLLCEYCIRDTDICRDIYYKLLPELTEQELQFQSMVLKSSTEPRAKIDIDILNKAIENQEIADRERIEIAKEYWGEDTAKFYRSRLTQQKLMQAYDLKSFDKDHRLTAMANNPNDKPLIAFCNALASIQEPNMPTFLKLKEFHSIKEGIPLPIRISGAHTHRMSGTGKLNFQNLPRAKSKDAPSARKAIIPLDSNHMFVGADSSQIEARVAAWICDDEEALNKIRKGIDVHLDMAINLYDIGTYEEAKKKLEAGDKYIKQCRQIAKSANFGAQYGMGSKKFKDYCFKSGIEITFEDAQYTINNFRKTRNKLTTFWNSTGQLILAALVCKQDIQIGKFFIEGTKERIILPDGMRMYYPNLTFHKGEFRCDKKPIWGGTILENLTQASATSIMKTQLNKFDKEHENEFVLNVHDAWVYTIPKEKAEKTKEELVQALSSSPSFCSNIPFNAEGDIATFMTH